MLTPGFKFRGCAQAVLWVVLISIFCFVFKNDKTQHLHWTFLYFSGAANHESFFDWRISPSDYEKAKAMSSEELRHYRFASTEDTIKNTISEYGYVMVVLMARNLFPFLGDIQAVVLLQVLAHIGLSIFVGFYLLRSRVQRSLFFVLYAINPLIIHIVTFPYYYFWSVLPGVALATVWLRRGAVRTWLPLLSVIMLFSISIRPTMILVVMVVFCVAFFGSKDRHGRIVTVISFIIFHLLLLLLYKGGAPRSLFHTAYIGIGGYSNPHGIDSLADQEGYRVYTDATGEKISTHPIQGNWRKPILQERYNQILKQRYIQIMRTTPLLIARNAILSTIQGYGVGYDVDRPWSRPITIAIGVVVMILLMVCRLWVWAIGILAYSVSFTLYFPPIPAYLFGAYLLSALGVSEALERIFSSRLRGSCPAHLDPSHEQHATDINCTPLGNPSCPAMSKTV